MIAEAHVVNLCEEYPRIIADVIEYGEEVPSRIGMTKEFIAYVLTLEKPQNCIVGRKGLSKDFMDMEIEMLLGGVFDEEVCRRTVARAADLLADSTAYGPRIAAQLPLIESELKKDALSRRAVAYVGRPDDLQSMHDAATSLERKGEMPCTMTWQFLIRDHRLHMIVSMRSWDLVWGLSYDVPNFVAVQMALAEALLCQVGHYYHIAGSAHVYQKHWDLDAWPNYDGYLDVPWIQPTIDETMFAAREQVALRKESLS